MIWHLINLLLPEIWDEIWLVVLSFWSFPSNQCLWLAGRISKGFCYAKLKIVIKLIKISKFHQKQTESSPMDKKKQLGKRNTNVWKFSNTRKCEKKEKKKDIWIIIMSYKSLFNLFIFILFCFKIIILFKILFAFFLLTDKSFYIKEKIFKNIWTFHNANNSFKFSIWIRI